MCILHHAREIAPAVSVRRSGAEATEAEVTRTQEEAKKKLRMAWTPGRGLDSCEYWWQLVALGQVLGSTGGPVRLGDGELHKRRIVPQHYQD
jgi:hypothetical protein